MRHRLPRLDAEVARYLVQKTEGPFGDTAWLSIPEDGNSANAAFVSDRSKATAFRFRITAWLWCWDLDAEIVPVDA